MREPLNEGISSLDLETERQVRESPDQLQRNRKYLYSHEDLIKASLAIIQADLQVKVLDRTKRLER
ncbi:hypothetical protein SAMN02799630_00712 [Paenibacillus sp. UNCCL117]|uniref:hypothetical protein n=1 Tax=unclassified Paenibacillus TaxID=185978 RepID=UPI0008854C6E|nr:MULTISPECIES: hypothetical protein [unclassified Paenibacillus]SDC17155.1 hypothetical protein SAMN04488602_101511 [Paenibacillus sp. cl123]SFW17950.1 hypothetical protein SAMN02799630_00712 [Paenibacillus sp. UNCCL117]